MGPSKEDRKLLLKRPEHWLSNATLDTAQMLCDNLEGLDGMGGGREVLEGKDIHIPMPDNR